jgi:curved DNA-binding protein CbpA
MEVLSDKEKRAVYDQVSLKTSVPFIECICLLVPHKLLSLQALVRVKPLSRKKKTIWKTRTQTYRPEVLCMAMEVLSDKEKRAVYDQVSLKHAYLLWIAYACWCHINHLENVETAV